MPPLYILVLLTTLLSFVRSATTDEACLSACSDWAITLGHCRAQYGGAPEQQNLTYANSFLNCLCIGSRDNGGIGNEAIQASAGICESCPSTSIYVQKDLSLFLELCVVQAQNGTASKVDVFKPQGFTTANDHTLDGALQSRAISPSASPRGVGAGVLGLVLLGLTGVGLAL